MEIGVSPARPAGGDSRPGRRRRGDAGVVDVELAHSRRIAAQHRARADGESAACSSANTGGRKSPDGHGGPDTPRATSGSGPRSKASRNAGRWRDSPTECRPGAPSLHPRRTTPRRNAHEQRGQLAELRCWILEVSDRRCMSARPRFAGPGRPERPMTATSATPPACSVRTAWADEVWLSGGQGRRALGRPIRRDCPAARMMPMSRGTAGSCHESASFLRLRAPFRFLTSGKELPTLAPFQAQRAPRPPCGRRSRAGSRSSALPGSVGPRLPPALLH